MLSRLKSFAKSLRGVKTYSGVVELFERWQLSECKSIGDYLKFSTRKVWAAWKAEDLIAQVVQTTPFAIYREGVETPAKIPDLQRLLSYPNQFQTFQELLYLTSFWIDVAGSAYWYKAMGRLDASRPQELLPLNPKRVTVAKDKAGEVIGYVYLVNGKEVPYDLEEVMHFKRPHPDNDYYGLGKFEAGEALIKEWVNHQTWKEGFYKNGAAPATLLTIKGQTNGTGTTYYTQAEFDALKARFHDQYGGAKNAGKTAWLQGEVELHRIGLSSEQMQDLERTQLTAEQIFQLCGVPLSVAGIREAANYATAAIEDRQFRAFTVWPVVRMIQDTMNTDLVTDWGDNLQIKFDVAGLVDVQKVVTDFGPLFDRGCVTRNEMRMKAGLPIVKGDPQMDEFFMLASYVPAALAGISATGGQQDQQAQRLTDDFTRKLLTHPKQ